MTQVTIYHNPRCSKSRQTLALLEVQDIEINVIEYLKTPPDADTLLAICHKLGRSPIDIIRTKEATFSELGLSSDDQRTDQAWCTLMTEHPILIERPIVVVGERAAVGRPPENVLNIL